MSGGYAHPGPSTSSGLTLTQFIQTVLVGMSGLDPRLVRPKWQEAPPKQPDLSVNWLAYAIINNTPDANGYSGTMPDNSFVYQRHEELEVGCSFYGPDAMDFASLVRDGFQIQPNLAALQMAKMGFKEVGPARPVPDLINERWINRIEMSVFIRREVVRTYPILTILSASGTIHGQGSVITSQHWQTN